MSALIAQTHRRGMSKGWPVVIIGKSPFRLPPLLLLLVQLFKQRVPLFKQHCWRQPHLTADSPACCFGSRLAADLSCRTLALFGSVTARRQLLFCCCLLSLAAGGLPLLSSCHQPLFLLQLPLLWLLLEDSVLINIYRLGLHCSVWWLLLLLLHWGQGMCWLFHCLLCLHTLAVWASMLA